MHVFPAKDFEKFCVLTKQLQIIGIQRHCLSNLENCWLFFLMNVILVVPYFFLFLWEKYLKETWF